MFLYLDQNYLSGIVKRKPGFRALEPVLREAVARGAVAVSGQRPDVLRLLARLEELPSTDPAAY